MNIFERQFVEYKEKYLLNSFANKKLTLDSVSTISVNSSQTTNNTNLKNRVLKKVEDYSDIVVELPSAKRLIEDSLDAAEDFEFVLDSVKKISEYIFSSKKMSNFSYDYLRAIKRKSDYKYFFFLNKYTEKSNGLNEMTDETITTSYNQLSELKNNYLDIFSITSNCVSKDLIDRNIYDYISSTSFIGQNLINLCYQDTFAYPNCLLTNDFSVIPADRTDFIQNYFIFYNNTENKMMSKQLAKSFLNSRLTNNLFINSNVISNKNSNILYVLSKRLETTNDNYIEVDSVLSGENTSFKGLSYSNKIINKNSIYSQEEAITLDNIKRLNSSYNLGYTKYRYAERIVKTYSIGNFSDNNTPITFSYVFNDYTLKNTVSSYFNNSTIQKNTSFIELKTQDNIFDSLFEQSNRDDQCYWSNNQLIFKDISLLFNSARITPTDKFKYSKNYNVKERYKHYLKEYDKAYKKDSIVIDTTNNDKFQFIGIYNSSRGTYLTKSWMWNGNEDSITFKESVEDQDIKLLERIKVLCNTSVNKYKKINLKENKVLNTLENLKESYKESIKTNNNYYDSIVGLEKGIVNKNSIDLDVIGVFKEDNMYLASENIPVSSNNIKSTDSRILEGIDISIPTNEDVLEFKKYTLAKNFMVNTKELNNEILKDVCKLFDNKNFSKTFINDYQISAFDKLISSYYTCGEFDSSEQYKDLSKLILATSITKNKLNKNIFSSNSNDKKLSKSSIQELENILKFKELCASIFSSENLMQQNTYFFETNTKTFSYGNEKVYRHTNSLAMCFPYNTLNLFSTSKFLTPESTIAEYYDYGVNELGLNRETVEKSIYGSLNFDNTTDPIVVTYPIRNNSGNREVNEYNNYFTPVPFAFRKINTIDSYKNTISSIEHIEEYKNNCETLAMFYIWDKQIDYKKIKLMSGKEISNLSEFIKEFSKKDEIPTFTSDYNNLISTSSYPLQEMFYINRKIENRLFSNSSNLNSLVGIITEKISKLLNVLEIKLQANDFKEAFQFASENEKIVEIIENIIKIYCSYYDIFYRRYFEKYFCSLQEIPYVKQNLYDTYYKDDIREGVMSNDYYRYYSLQNNQYTYYNNFRNFGLIRYLGPQGMVLSNDQKKFISHITGDYNEINTKNINKYGEEYFVYGVCNGFNDTILTTNIEIDKEYMFQEYYSSIFYPSNAVSPFGEEKLKIYETAFEDMTNILHSVNNNIQLQTGKILSYCEQNNMKEYFYEEDEGGLVNIYKDINNTLVRNDISYAFSMDIFLNYIYYLNEVETNSKKEIKKISEDISNIDFVKKLYNEEEKDFIFDITNIKYFSKLVQMSKLLEKYKDKIFQSLKNSDVQVADNPLRKLDITSIESSILKRKHDFCNAFISQVDKASSYDILFLNVENFNYEGVLTKITLTNKRTGSTDTFYYLPNIVHHEFFSDEENIQNVSVIDINEDKFESMIKFVNRESISSYLPYSENIDIQSAANDIFKTYITSNFCKAYLEINSINYIAAEDIHKHVSLNTVGLLEDIGQNNVRIIFDIKDNPDFSNEVTQEIYENVTVDYSYENKSTIREYASILSKYNSNYLLQKIMSYENVEKYIMLLVPKQLGNQIDSYTINVEQIL